MLAVQDNNRVDLVNVPLAAVSIYAFSRDLVGLWVLALLLGKTTWSIFRLLESGVNQLSES